jgi:hypothetical protein
VFDWYLLSRSKYPGTVTLPDISDKDYAQVTDAANWMETKKYAGSGVAEQYIAGALLLRFVNESEKMLSGNTQQYPPVRRMIEYSGHYPILLGVLAALKLDTVDMGGQNAVKTTIPPCSAALIWELHTGGEVRLFWRNGTDASIEPIPCDSKGSYSCSVESLKARLNGAGAPKTKLQFCSLCGSSAEVNPDLCPAKISAAHLITRSSLVGAGVGGALLGLLVGAAAMLVLWRFCGFQRREKEAKFFALRGDSSPKDAMNASGNCSESSTGDGHANV